MTIRDFEYFTGATESKTKWMNCFKVIADQNIVQVQPLCSKQDWDGLAASRILLHIDLEKQQVYHLPVLLGCTHCVYLVVFNLPPTIKDHENALKKIHNAMKNIFAYSKYKPSMRREEQPARPKVFLVAMNAEKCADNKDFAEKLRKELRKWPYWDIISNTATTLFLEVQGSELDMKSENSLLSAVNKSHCLWPSGPICKWIQCYYDLLAKFGDRPVLYSDLRSHIQLPKESHDQCLSFLHSYGFIYSPSISDLKGLNDSKSVVLLQPQKLCSVLDGVQELGKERKLVHVADLISTNGLHHSMQPWFEKIFTVLGLVIERSIETEALFIVGMDSIPSVQYSIDPLLMALELTNIHSEFEHLMPAHLYTTFINEFLKGLHRRFEGQLKIRAAQQGYVHVDQQGMSHIHVIERHPYIEIGIQQGVISNRAQDEGSLEKLQTFCQDVWTVVNESMKSIAQHLELEGSKLCLGFNACCVEGKGCFNKLHFRNENPNEYHLECSQHRKLRCGTPRQEIWFQKSPIEKVSSYVPLDSIVSSHVFVAIN